MNEIKAVASFTILEDGEGNLYVRDRSGEAISVNEFEFWLNEYRNRSLPLVSINTRETNLLNKHLRVFSRSTGPGYVYLIGINDQVFKIGQTGHLKARIASLRREVQRERGLDIELIHVIEAQNRHRAEARLHQAYAAKRFSGEWFSLNEQDVAEIKAISQIGGVQ